jgi:hypothetical protein
MSKHISIEACTSTWGRRPEKHLPASTGNEADTMSTFMQLNFQYPAHNQSPYWQHISRKLSHLTQSCFGHSINIWWIQQVTRLIGKNCKRRRVQMRSVQFRIFLAGYFKALRQASITWSTRMIDKGWFEHDVERREYGLVQVLPQHLSGRTK